MKHLIKIGFLYFILCSFTLSANAAFVLDKLNMFSDPEVKTANGWRLNNMTTFDANVSVTKNSGSIRLDGFTGHGFHSPRLDVSPNTIYTCSIMYRGDVWPSTAMRMGVTIFTQNNQKIRNIKGASNWNYPKGGEKKWHRAYMIFKTDAKTKFLRLLMSKPVSMNREQPVWIDHPYCAKGVLIKGDPTPKKDFIGELVQVYGSGVIMYKGKRTFPRCMFADHQFEGDRVQRIRTYVKAGWNCNMWVASLKQAEISIQGGMDYIFIALAPYIDRRGWGTKHFNYDMTKTVAALKKHVVPILEKYGDKVIGWYYDDESNEAYLRAERILKEVVKLDTVNGKRQRPIYILKGNEGALREDLHHADVTGTYTSGGDTAGQGGGASSHLVMAHMEGQYLPVVFAQINKGVNNFWQVLKPSLPTGVTAIGYWRDETRKNWWVDRQPWWNEFKSVTDKMWAVVSARQIDQGSGPIVDDNNKPDPAQNGNPASLPNEQAIRELIADQIQPLQREIKALKSQIKALQDKLDRAPK